MTREEVIKLVQDSELNEEVKTTWVSLINEAGLTQDVIDGLKQVFDDAIDVQLVAGGFGDNPELKAADEEMVAEVEAATQEYVSAMKEVEDEAKTLEAETTPALEQLQADAIKASIAE